MISNYNNLSLQLLITGGSIFKLHSTSTDAVKFHELRYDMNKHMIHNK